MLLNILLSMRHKEDDLCQRCFARWGVPAARVGDCACGTVGNHACGTGRKFCLRQFLERSIYVIGLKLNISNWFSLHAFIHQMAKYLNAHLLTYKLCTQ